METRSRAYSLYCPVSTVHTPPIKVEGEMAVSTKSDGQHSLAGGIKTILNRHREILSIHMSKVKNIIIPACMSIIDNAAWFNGLYKIIKFQ